LSISPHIIENMRNSGADEGIRTIEPNLGKHAINSQSICVSKIALEW